MSLRVNSPISRCCRNFKLLPHKLQCFCYARGEFQKNPIDIEDFGEESQFCQADYGSSNDEFYWVLNSNMPSEGSINTFWLICRVFRATMGTSWSFSRNSSFAQNSQFSATYNPNLCILRCCTSYLLVAAFMWGHCITVPTTFKICQKSKWNL